MADYICLCVQFVAVFVFRKCWQMNKICLTDIQKEEKGRVLQKPFQIIIDILLWYYINTWLLIVSLSLVAMWTLTFLSRILLKSFGLHCIFEWLFFLYIDIILYYPLENIGSLNYTDLSNVAIFHCTIFFFKSHSLIPSESYQKSLCLSESCQMHGVYKLSKILIFTWNLRCYYWQQILSGVFFKQETQINISLFLKFN